MLDALTQSLRIGCAATGVGLLKTRRWPFGRHTVLATDMAPVAVPDAPRHWSGAVREAILRCGGTGLAARIVLSDDLVRLFMVTPPRNATRMQDCQAAAAMRFRLLYDMPVADWQLLADWDARHPFLACAMPRVLRDGLLQALQPGRLGLVEMAPQFVVALNRWRHALEPDAWFGVVHQGSLTLGIPSNSRLHAVRMLRGPETGLLDRAGLVALLLREALRLEQPVPQRLQLCGTVPSAWLVPSTGGLRCIQLGSEQAATSFKERGRRVSSADLREPALSLAATGLRL